MQPQEMEMRTMQRNKNDPGQRRPTGSVSSLLAGMTLSVATLAGLPLQAAWAQSAASGGVAALPSLRSVDVPGPSAAALRELVRDKKAAIQLGKALFWDSRVGSDNKTACASCHFHAGADNRIKNQINPGLLAGDTSFQLAGPNHTLTAADFPLTRFSHVDDAASRSADVNDVIGSQGVLTALFRQGAVYGKPDDCSSQPDGSAHGGSGFSMAGVNTRRVEPRNTPSVINAVYNFRNFWDGRANNMFNAGDIFGLRNPNQLVWKVTQGQPRRVRLQLASAALASQAIGPPLSENEMSCKQRDLMGVARKLLPLKPLAQQRIAWNDSVLADLKFAMPTYSALIQRAFEPAWWQSDALIRLDDGQPMAVGSMDLERSQHAAARRGQAGTSRSEMTRVNLMEANFGLFFGLALQLYQATLVADDTPFDRYADGQADALSPAQLRGMALFRGQGVCIHCHSGAEQSAASLHNVINTVRLIRRPGADATLFQYDTGFFNTGVRPTADDPGVGGLDPFGMPLSETRMAQRGQTGLLGNDFHEDAIAPDALTALDGAFKTPMLRNVELTGPYFHNGGKATLMQVVDFYNRGGDFTVQNQPTPDPTIRPLGLDETQKHDLVAFLLGLTDERVRYQQAPFDHPSLCVPNGHAGDDMALLLNRAGNAVDDMLCLPAVGATGATAPLRAFLELDPYKH
jgi:cytochrome c peroxidase